MRPISAIPLLFFLASASVCSAANVNSVTDGAYTTGSTWSDGNPPSPTNDYFIQSGDHVNVTSTSDETLTGGSLTVNSGGIFRRQNNNTSRHDITIPNFSLNGGRLYFEGNNQYSRTFGVLSNVNVAADSDIRLSSGRSNPSYNVYLDGGITGTGDLLINGNLNNNSSVRVTTTNLSYSGDWTLDSIDSGQTRLFAEAAGALGTGTVTLETRGQLFNSAEGGLDSLTAVILDDASSLLTLTEGWNNDDASLVLNDGTLDLADSMSQIGSFSIAGNDLLGGTYSADDLTSLGYGGTFLGTGSITVIPEPASIAVWSILGLGLAAAGIYHAQKRRRAATR